MARFSGMPNVVHAIRAGVAAARRSRAAQGWYDSHDVINWLDANHNSELNDVIDCYAPTSSDPVHTATIQIGNYLRDHLGEVKIGVNTSYRHISLRGGGNRNGECEVSKWRI